MRSHEALRLALLVGTFAWPCFANAAGEANANRLPEITVEGRREEVKREMRHFVEHITRPDFLGRSLARWLKPICPAAFGLKREDGEYVLARVSTIADAAKAPLSTDSACKPNLFIVFTHDPKAYLKVTLRKYPYLFQNGGRGGATDLTNLASPARVREFLDSKIPVRVWYNTNSYTDSGNGTTTSMFTTSSGVQIRGQERVRIASPKLWYGSVEGFDDVIVLVDTSLTRGMSLAMVVDYVSMVGLMELQRDPRIDGAPTILAAFNGAPDRPAALTAWDTAFLAGLYATEQYSHGQRDLIVDRMMAQVMP